MKGLILKDLYMIKKYCMMLILMVIIFAVVSAVNDGAIFTVYPVMLAGLVPSTLIAYEERAKWDVYSSILPVKKSDIVIEKYIVSLGGILGAVILVCAAHSVKLAAAGVFSLSALFSFSVVLISVSMIGPVIVLPFTFGLGLEKGRLVYYFAVGAVCAMAVIMSSVELPSISIPSIIVLLFDAAVVAGSAFVSVKLYEKRELA